MHYKMASSDPQSKRKNRRRARVGAAEALTLRALDQRRIAVQLVINGNERLVKGVGEFGLDAKLGGVLRIECADAKGGFELLIRESDWNGQIKPGTPFGCDYFVYLSLSEK